MHGQFSMKSDVYSFGVLVLEIICGKRNSNFHETDDSGKNLVTHVSTKTKLSFFLFFSLCCLIMLEV